MCLSHLASRSLWCKGATLSKLLEHPLDRFSRLGINVVIKYEYEDGVWFRQKGRGHSRWYWLENPVTKLKTCELCRKTSTPKKVTHRDGIYGWNFHNKEDLSFESKDVLCVGCWNKVRSLIERKHKADEVGKIINELERTISHEHKNQNHR